MINIHSLYTLLYTTIAIYIYSDSITITATITTITIYIGKLSLREVRNSNLFTACMHVDEETDINKVKLIYISIYFL